METREDLIGLLEQFKNNHTYEGTGVDMFTNLIAFTINRPIIIVDMTHSQMLGKVESGLPAKI